MSAERGLVDSHTAQLRVLLPFYVGVGPVPLVPLVYAVDDYRVTVAPPYRSMLSGDDLVLDSTLTPAEVAERFEPRVSTDWPPVYLVDDVPWELANTFQVNFDRDSPYDRSPDSDDPPIEFCFDAVNSFLVRLRISTMSAFTRPVQRNATIWRLSYLGADGRPVERDPARRTIAARAGKVSSANVVTLTGPVWEAVDDLPDTFRPRPWDTVLLDAFAALPELGAAIVLAHTAIEMRIDDALPRLAAQFGLAPGVWKWIDERERDYRREPSITEKLDILLGWLGGRSVAHDPTLWGRYQRLKRVRNKFVHEGRLIDQEQPLSLDVAQELLVAARGVLDHIESQLAPDQRRPPEVLVPMTLEVRQVLQ
jgi:hypothetical protein